jgi:hypothetical protein
MKFSSTAKVIYSIFWINGAYSGSQGGRYGVNMNMMVGDKMTIG